MKQHRTDDGEEFSPRDYMRARRPELFSDAVVSSQTPPIDRPVFEFHLDTLTSRKEEIRFEHFCRRLAEKEVCPNLIPQAGPTGGGDSKVDTETYPVDSSISVRWYHGAQQAASERWAFAFSAKEDWRSKVRSDVAGIVATGRSYTRIFFMTNQSVSDRKRAAVEDELTRSTGKDVRILDRGWIIDRVYENKRWDVVYQTLDLERPASERQVTPGPLDAQRRLELSELDALVGDQERYAGSKYQLVEDCLASALLARGLGAARSEIIGRLDRAERLARSRDDAPQVARVLYNRAWTAYWWFNDFDELDRLYGDIEELIIDSVVVWNLERLVTLWQIGVVGALDLPDEDRHRWSARSDKLIAALTTHAEDPERQTSALWAETEICLMRLTLGAIDSQPPDSTFGALQDILERAEGHLDYPFSSVLQIVSELGPHLGHLDAYDNLFESAMTIQAGRTGSGEEGRLRLERGWQRLEAGDYYGAISNLAKAQSLLAHDEQREEFLRALAGTALAYDAVGLPWAARANLVFALDRSLYQYHRSGEIAPQAVPLLRKLIWVELRLGRVPCALLWIDMLNVIGRAVQLGAERSKALREERLIVESVLGILILRTTLLDWGNLERLAGHLESLDLLIARGAALFALGHEEMLRREFEQPDEDLDQYFGMLLHQPAADEVPERPEWHTGTTVAMETTILGCHVRLVAANEPTTLVWGETILGFLEAFFSTTLRLQSLMSMRPNLTLDLSPAAGDVHAPLTVIVVEDDSEETTIRLTHSRDSIASQVKQESFHEAFVQLLGVALAELQLSGSAEWIESYFRDERAQDRAGLVAQSALAATNVLGEQPKYYVEEQIDESVIERLSVLRSEAWNAPEVDSRIAPQSATPQGAVPSGGSIPPGLVPERHRDVVVQSVVNLPLWDRARWCGTVFLTASAPDEMPPVLALFFEDADAAQAILRGWHDRYGASDNGEEISITIITGIDAAHPCHYRVVIGPKLSFEEDAGTMARFVGQVLRFQEMTPDSSVNLDRFLTAFEAMGGYLLGAASGPQNSPRVNRLMIEKRELHVRPAWTIGPHDPVMIALQDLTNPVVPAEEEDAPVWGALDRLAGRADEAANGQPADHD